MSATDVRPIAVDVVTACGMVSLSRPTIDRAIRDGDLPVKYLGRKPLIRVTDLEAWYDALPSVKP